MLSIRAQNHNIDNKLDKVKTRLNVRTEMSADIAYTDTYTACPVYDVIMPAKFMLLHEIRTQLKRKWSIW